MSDVKILRLHFYTLIHSCAGKAFLQARTNDLLTKESTAIATVQSMHQRIKCTKLPSLCPQLTDSEAGKEV